MTKRSGNPVNALAELLASKRRKRWCKHCRHRTRPELRLDGTIACTHCGWVRKCTGR